MIAPEAGRPLAGGTARRGFCSERNNFRNIPTRRPLQSPRYDPRFRRQIEAVHRLGPVALGYLVEELAAGRDLRQTVATYVALDAGLIGAYGADRFPALLHAVGRKP